MATDGSSAVRLLDAFEGREEHAVREPGVELGRRTLRFRVTAEASQGLDAQGLPLFHQAAVPKPADVLRYGRQRAREVSARYGCRASLVSGNCTSAFR